MIGLPATTATALCGIPGPDLATTADGARVAPATPQTRPTAPISVERALARAVPDAIDLIVKKPSSQIAEREPLTASEASAYPHALHTSDRCRHRTTLVPKRIRMVAEFGGALQVALAPDDELD